MATIAMVVTLVISALVTAALGFWGIPKLRKLKFGQTILEIGPRWHKDKQGTPTMGGILFVIGILAGIVVGYPLLQAYVPQGHVYFTSGHKQKLFAGIVMALAFGIVGFIDDYIKVRHKENEGLTEKQKLIFQFVISALYIATLYIIGDRSTIVWFPFVGQINLGILYYPLAIGGIIYLINAVNFTDGIDGLCTTVTLVSAIGFFTAATLFPGGNFITVQLLSVALGGGCIGFLVWNVYPAKVFMGDTGSFFLGGVIIALAFSMGTPVLLLFMGFIYIIEGVTVIIQRYYFKFTRIRTGKGKRIFLMTPIHHHYEMKGWSENRIVLVFSLIQLLASLIGILAIQSM